MKRSVMIDIITEALATDGVVKFAYSECTHSTASTYDQIADFILNVIEKEGMMPPLSDWHTSIEWEQNYPVYCWESEDEET